MDNVLIEHYFQLQLWIFDKEEMMISDSIWWHDNQWIWDLIKQNHHQHHPNCQGLLLCPKTNVTTIKLTIIVT